MIVHVLAHLLLLVCVCTARPGESSEEKKKTWNFLPSLAAHALPGSTLTQNIYAHAHITPPRWLTSWKSFLFHNLSRFTCCVIGSPQSFLFHNVFMLLSLQNNDYWRCKNFKKKKNISANNLGGNSSSWFNLYFCFNFFTQIKARWY